MKKLRFYVPVLAIACMGILFSATSCVDDSESQSVTNLRGARAAQLQAEADYTKAKIEIERITADANAALAIAEAAYQDAQTEALKATTAQGKAEWDAKASLRAKEIEGLIKAAEAELEAQKLVLLQNQQALLKAIAEYAAEGDPELKAAADAYADAILDVNDYTLELAGHNIDLMVQENMLKGLKNRNAKALENFIQTTKRNIAKKEVDEANEKADLARWQNLLKSNDVANLQKEIDKAKADEKVIRFTQLPALEAKRLQAETAYDNAEEAWDDFYTAAYDWSIGKLYTIAELNVIINDLKADKTKAEADKTKAEADFTDATSKLVGLHTTYRNAEKALTDAQTKRDKVYSDPTSTQAQKDDADLDVANKTTAYSNAQLAYNNGQTKVENAQRSVESLTYSVDYLTTEIAAKEKVKALYADESTPATLKAAYDNALKVYNEASLAKYEKESEANTLKAYYEVLERNDFSIETIKDKIADCEDAIGFLQADLIDMNQSIDDETVSYKEAEMSTQKQIDKLKAQIDQTKRLLSAATKIADTAKAIIDQKVK